MCEDHHDLVAMAQEAEDLKGKTDDESFFRRRNLLLEIEAHGENINRLLGAKAEQKPRCLSKTSVSLPATIAVFI
jgi:hypothetical protein